MAKNALPDHVAVIMDGNGRWAKKRGLPRAFGHREGAATVKKIVTHAAKSGVKVLSMFAFSAENWLRPAEEVGFLMKLLDDYIASESRLMMENNIRFLVSGRMEMMPERTGKALRELSSVSSGNTGMTLNLLISYGAKDELADAVRHIARDAAKGRLNWRDVDGALIRSRLYNPELPDVDLLIRTSGERRISNFMLWRIAYAELYFTDILWPDFSEKDFDAALEDFAGRVRRFGKTDEQVENRG